MPAGAFGAPAPPVTLPPGMDFDGRYADAEDSYVVGVEFSVYNVKTNVLSAVESYTLEIEGQGVLTDGVLLDGLDRVKESTSIHKSQDD